VGLDYAAFIDVIGSESRRLVAALEADRDAAVPWSDTWTVKECAQHLGATHRVVSQVIEGRPTTDFGAFRELALPDASDPALGQWVAASTAALTDQLRSVGPDEPCWSWWPAGTAAGFWARRMAHETLVHRWDAELGAGAGRRPSPMDPGLAADGVDEYLDVFAAMVRARASAPGRGETAHVHCTDADGEWLIAFPEVGARELRREHAKGDVAFRGPAEGLLLFLWGRVDADAGGVEVIGDAGVAARWRELVPPV
jgi:uncharacterized protein (TIGR03083 family)